MVATIISSLAFPKHGVNLCEIVPLKDRGYPNLSAFRVKSYRKLHVSAMARRNRGFGDKPKRKVELKDAVQSSEEKEEVSVPSIGAVTPVLSEDGKVRRRPAPEKPVLTVQSSEKEQQFDNFFIITLGILFSLVFIEGVFLAAAGFLPEEVDKFAVEVVYPIFSPSVLLFLALAATYGFLRYLGLPKFSDSS